MINTYIKQSIDDFMEKQLRLLSSCLIIITCYLGLVYVAFQITGQYYPYYISLIRSHQTAPIFNYKTLLLFITSPFNRLEVYAGTTNFYNFIFDPIILFILVTTILMYYNYTIKRVLRGSNSFNWKNSVPFLLLPFPASYLVSVTTWLEGYMPASGSSIVAEYLFLALYYILYIWAKDFYLKNKNKTLPKKKNLLLLSFFIVIALISLSFIIPLTYRSHIYGLIYSFMFIILFHFRSLLLRKLYALRGIFVPAN